MPQLSLHTAVGDLIISQCDDFIVALHWGWAEEHVETPLLCEARRQIRAYLDGRLRQFDLPLKFYSGTVYQKSIWNTLQTINYGAVCSYADITEIVGGSPRSVGSACGKNPLPIFIPCHRVVGAQGLTGYSGGSGVQTKKWLLALEHDQPDRLRSGCELSSQIEADHEQSGWLDENHRSQAEGARV